VWSNRERGHRPVQRCRVSSPPSLARGSGSLCVLSAATWARQPPALRVPPLGVFRGCRRQLTPSARSLPCNLGCNRSFPLVASRCRSGQFRHPGIGLRNRRLVVRIHSGVLTYGKSGDLLPTSGLTSHQSDLEVVMVAVHDQGRLDDDRPHYVMKLVEGQTLG